MHTAYAAVSHPQPALPLHSAQLAQGAASVQQLERRSFNAWPGARSAVVGDWLLRSANGYTKRANSANALQPAATLDAALLAHIERWYARQRQPAIFRLSPLADLAVDALLHHAGYAVLEPSVFMQRAVHPADSACAVPEGWRVQVAASPHAPWQASYAAASGMTDEALQHLQALQQAIGMPCAYVSVLRGTQVLGWGLAVLELHAVGLYEVLVHPAHRGQGIGRRVLAALLQWACQQGASHTDLQVVGTNAPAQQLYASLGFVPVYGYHYRVQRTCA